MRGRTIRAPRGQAVRPTSDRVREAMFDVLASLDAVEESSVLDLYAGSGALGIEALSRGASSVVFVEHDRPVCDVIDANLASTGTGILGEVRVVCGDASTYLASTTMSFDLALIDPPYVFTQWNELLSGLDAAVVVAESSRPVELPAPYELHRVYRYSTTLVTVAFGPSSAQRGRL